MKKLLTSLFILLSVSSTLLFAASLALANYIQQVEIIVDSYSFKPDTITVEAGVPVEITLRSIASTTPHDFTINDPESGMRITQDVKGGRDVTFTFTPENPGTYEFYCSKKGIFGSSHKEKGMVGTLIVR